MPLDNQHNPVAPSSHAARARGCTCHMNIAALTSELAAAVLAWDALNPTMNAHLTAWHDGSDLAETKRVAGLLYDLAERLRMIGADE